MKKLNVALLAGGNSSERGVSLQSAAQVADAFDPTKYSVFLIDIQGRDWLYRDAEGNTYTVDRNDFSLTLAGGKIALEYAFIMIHGTPGEDGKLQGYLEMMGIPFSSCDLVSTVVTFDKSLCKLSVSGIAGMNLARAVLLNQGADYDPSALGSTLGFPMFVKPNASGSSYGVSKVSDIEGIAPALQKAFVESAAVIIEEYLPGREFACGVICTWAAQTPLPVTEIVSHNEFFDFEAKYTPGFSDEITPAPISASLTSELQRLASEACRACGCRGIVRVDFIVTPDEKPYMIEINTVPGMSSGSIVPKQLTAAGMTMTQMIDIIIEDSL